MKSYAFVVQVIESETEKRVLVCSTNGQPLAMVNDVDDVPGAIAKIAAGASSKASPEAHA